MLIIATRWNGIGNCILEILPQFGTEEQFPQKLRLETFYARLSCKLLFDMYTTVLQLVA